MDGEETLDGLQMEAAKTRTLRQRASQFHPIMYIEALAGISEAYFA